MKAIKWSRISIAGLLALLALPLLAACGSDPTPTATPQPTATPTQPGDPVDPFQAEWQELIEAARAEGEIHINVGGGSGNDMSQGWQRDFGDQFGIQVNTYTGRSVDLYERVSAERSAGMYTLDAWVTSGRFPKDVLVPAGMAQEIQPLLIHPEVLDLSAWYNGHFWWSDDEQMYSITFWGNGGNASIPYNTERMTPEEVDNFRSWMDFGKPELKGEIILRDYTHGTWVCQYVEFGEAWFRAVFENEPMVQGNDRQGAEWLARGVGKIGLGVGGTEVLELKEGGLPAEPEFPHPLAECNNLSSASGNMVVIDQAPNQNAVKLFLNWILSKEGQYSSQEWAGSDSLRLDIPKDNVRPDNLRLEDVEYIFDCCEPRFTGENYQAALDMFTNLGREYGAW